MTRRPSPSPSGRRRRERELQRPRFPRRVGCRRTAVWWWFESRPTSSWDIGALDLSIYLYPSVKLIVAQRNAGWALGNGEPSHPGMEPARFAPQQFYVAAVRCRDTTTTHRSRARRRLAAARVSACPGTPIRIQEASNHRRQHSPSDRQLPCEKRTRRRNEVSWQATCTVPVRAVGEPWTRRQRPR